MKLMKHLPFLNVLFHGLESKVTVIYAHIQLTLKDAKTQVVVNHLELKMLWNFLKPIMVFCHLLPKLRMDTLQILFIYFNIVIF